MRMDPQRRFNAWANVISFIVGGGCLYMGTQSVWTTVGALLLAWFAREEDNA